MIYTALYNSPIGRILLAEENGGLIGLWFEGQKYFFASVRGETCESQTPVLCAAEDWLC